MQAKVEHNILHQLRLWDSDPPWPYRIFKGKGSVVSRALQCLKDLILSLSSYLRANRSNRLCQKLCRKLPGMCQTIGLCAVSQTGFCSSRRGALNCQGKQTFCCTWSWFILLLKFWKCQSRRKRMWKLCNFTQRQVELHKYGRVSIAVNQVNRDAIRLWMGRWSLSPGQTGSSVTYQRRITPPMTPSDHHYWPIAATPFFHNDWKTKDIKDKSYSQRQFWPLHLWRKIGRSHSSYEIYLGHPGAAWYCATGSMGGRAGSASLLGGGGNRWRPVTQRQT